MTIRNHLALALGALLLAAAPGAGCKKKTSADKGKTGAEPMGSASSVPARLGPRPRPAGPAAASTLIPIPADLPAMHFFVKALRATSFYKQQEGPLSKALMTRSTMGGALAHCKLDLVRDVDASTVGIDMSSGSTWDFVVQVQVPRKLTGILACVKTHLAKQKIQVKELTVANRPGITVTYSGRSASLIVLNDNSLVLSTGALRARVNAILEGKAKSITTTKAYQDIRKQIGPNTLIGAIVPTLPDAMLKRLPPFLQGFKTGAVLVNLPKDGLDVKVSLRFEDAAMAKMLAKNLPALVRLAGAKYGPVKALGERVKTSSKQGWAYLDFRLDKTTGDRLFGLINGLLVKATQDTAKKAD